MEGRREIYAEAYRRGDGGSLETEERDVGALARKMTFRGEGMDGRGLHRRVTQFW